MSPTALVVLDDIIRGILLVATAASYYPQASRILHGGYGSAGISLFYLGLLAISGMEQFFLFTYDFMFRGEPDGPGVLADRTVGDWLNLFQLIVFVTLSSSLYLLAALAKPRRPRETIPTAILFAMFFVLSMLTSLPYYASLPYHKYPPTSGHDRTGRDIFWGLHEIWICPVVVFGVLPTSLLVQWLEMHRREVPRAMSEIGLIVQAVVGVLVGVSWCWRMDRGIEKWYIMVLNLAWGVVQGLVALYIAWRQHVREQRLSDSHEGDQPDREQVGDREHSEGQIEGERESIATERTALLASSGQ